MARPSTKGLSECPSLSTTFTLLPNGYSIVWGSKHRTVLPEGREPLIARFGPVIGTYAGPGALGLSFLRAKAG